MNATKKTWNIYFFKAFLYILTKVKRPAKSFKTGHWMKILYKTSLKNGPPPDVIFILYLKTVNDHAHFCECNQSL